ncbi:MAG: hypothetical protein GEV12_05190 [Micromonosporaceae bacterium]|nr:hypothetical protein [Micromonosporaceae bacterium]
MSRQSAQRRTQRQQQQRSAEGARAAREQQRREARRQARSKPGAGRGRRTGWAGMRRSRGQRVGIAVVAALGIALIWLLVDWPLAIGLTALLLVALPAFVVLAMGRRY